MHPRLFLDSLWRNDLRDEVFVAMSFQDKFNERWENIFKPAIESIAINENTLKANRVDIRKTGNSIHTLIIDGIAQSQLVIADVSVQDRWQETKNNTAVNRWAVNGNVMYELGLAIACRQAVEVIIVADKTDIELKDLLFDIGTIKIVSFDPSTPDKASEIIRTEIIDRINERKLEEDLRVAKIRESLTSIELNSIKHYWKNNPTGTPIKGGSEGIGGMTIISSDSLAEKGILRFIGSSADSSAYLYNWTSLGKAVASSIS